MPTVPPIPVEGWYQTQEGDVHAQGEIFDSLPNSESSYSIYREGSFPGIVSSADRNPFFGAGQISVPQNWLVEFNYRVFPRRTHDYFFGILNSPPPIPFDGDLNQITDGVYSFTEMVVANAFDLRRNFAALGGGDYDPDETPTETFRYDISLLMNQDLIWYVPFTWKEIAP